MSLRQPLATAMFGCAMVAVMAVSGCASGDRYHKIVTMDSKGNLLSTWVAKGYVWRRDGGYRFTAIERQIDKPRRLYRYPHGIPAFIKAPDTVIYRVEAPCWYLALDPLQVADVAEAGYTVTPPLTVPRGVRP